MRCEMWCTCKWFTKGRLHHSRFSSELDQVGRRELVHVLAELDPPCSALNLSLNLNRRFRAIKRWSLLFYTSKTTKMAARTNNDMLILEFLSVTKPSRRREVKEQLDALTKYDNSEFRARFHLSKLTVHHLPSELVCHTVHPPSFWNIIQSVYGENLQKFTTSKYR